jgi:hypothetical protein
MKRAALKKAARHPFVNDCESSLASEVYRLMRGARRVEGVRGALHAFPDGRRRLCPES